MGRTSCQNKQQVGQETNGMDTKRETGQKKGLNGGGDDIKEKAGSAWTRVAQDRRA